MYFLNVFFLNEIAKETLEGIIVARFLLHFKDVICTSFSEITARHHY